MVTLDGSLKESVLNNWREAALSPRERAMLEYAEKLTLEPRAMRRADIEALRAAGLDDRAILQVNLIASYFNYINRVADGLGVGKSQSE
jgi:uncharacterized peroxidase-related enzyme